MSSGLDNVVFEVEGAQGMWDGRQLALDLPWRKDGISLSLQIIARKEPMLARMTEYAH